VLTISLAAVTCTLVFTDALVFVENNGKELPENNLLSQFWRGRYKEFLLPPRQSVVRRLPRTRV
jgi:hypothetical protein